MMQLTLYSLILTFSMIFMTMNHPLSMGLILLIQTMIMANITGMMTKTFWFSYILFLILVGGMLVLFIYVTSLASNEMFSLSMMSVNLIMGIFMTMMIIVYMLDKSITSYNSLNNEMMSIINMNSYMEENSLNLNKLYNYPNNTITIMLMNYLLITLIATVKITKLFYGPLRMMF